MNLFLTVSFFLLRGAQPWTIPSPLQRTTVLTSLIKSEYVSFSAQSSLQNITVRLEYPTGLYLIEKERVLQHAARNNILLPSLERRKKNEFFCVLEHNTIALNPLYSSVYALPRILSQKQCQYIIDIAENYAATHEGWTKTRHTGYPTTDLPLEAVFGRFSSIGALLAGEILPIMAEKYNLDEKYLRIGEMFIAKYEFSAGKQSSLAAHQDGTPFSFVLSLNQADVDFEGGGTRFVHEEGGRGRIYRPLESGSGIIFSGRKLHEGVAVTRGVRYILTGFCEYYPEDGTHVSYLANYEPQFDGKKESTPFSFIEFFFLQ